MPLIASLRWRVLLYCWGVLTVSAVITSTAPGQENAWREEANESIRKIRQREIRIRVTDEHGAPIAGADVEVSQKAMAFPFGAALSPTVLNDANYQEFFLSHFNWAVFENEMKWYSNEGGRGRENYARSDAMVQWCKKHGIPLRGHCIYWAPEKWQPRWLTSLTAEELRHAVEQRAQSIVSRYRNVVVHWDVNNEMLHGSFFEERLGEDIRPWMFERTHALDPDAKLFVNEFNVLTVDKDFTEPQVDQYVEQVRTLIAAGAPIHGVGVQGHVWSADAVKHPEAIKSNLDKIAELGLPIWITEFDSAFEDGEMNADALEAVYRTAFGHPAVEGIVMWVFWAGNSWRGSNAGLAHRDWRLTAAGARYESLMGEWSTESSGTTDSDGSLGLRCFHGEHAITVRTGSSMITEKTIQVISGDGPIRCRITVHGD